MADKRPHADVVNPFGEEIDRWMKRRGIRSSRELGSRAGVSARTIDRWLQPGFKMHREPDSNVLDKVAGALRMPPSLMRRLVAQARGYESDGTLTEAQHRVVMTMGALPEPVQDDVADAVIAIADAVRRMTASEVPETPAEIPLRDQAAGVKQATAEKAAAQLAERRAAGKCQGSKQ